MAFVDRSIQNDFTSLNPGEFPNLTGLSVQIQSEPLLASLFQSIQIDGDNTRIFFSAALSGPAEAALDTIVADHLATDDEADPDESPIENVSTINGTDFSAFVVSTDSHIASTSNPHNTSMANLPNFPLAEINAKLNGGDLDFTTDPRDPNAHQSTHVAGGVDEIAHNDLAGLTLGDPHNQYTTPARARAAAPIQPTTGIPANSFGQDGDLAVDPAGAVLYEKVTGAWQIAEDLVGPQGQSGFGVGAFGRTLANGTLVEGRGLTVSRVSAGTYQYTLTQPASNTLYGIFVQPLNTLTDTNSEVATTSITVNGFIVQVGQGDNGNANDVLVDTDHAIFVFGVGVQGPFGITSAYESWLNAGNVGTEADFVADLIGPAGPGVPTGGLTGQFLRKASGTNFDLEYVTITPALIGAEVENAVVDHVAEADPHIQYLNILRFQQQVSNLTTDDISEGSSLYFTQARVSANTDVAANTAHRNITSGNPHGTTAVQVGAIPVGEKATANGVATLDGSGKIPSAQIPASAIPSFDVVADIPARDALDVQEGDEAFVISNGLQYIFDGTSWFERPGNADAVVGAPSSIDNTLPRFDGTNGKLIQGSGVSVDDSDNLDVPGDITVSGTVDGVDLQQFQTDTQAHINSTANPHSTSLANIGPGTLPQLNAALQGATLDDSSQPRDPNAHAATHSLGSSDEISVQDLASGPGSVGRLFSIGAAGVVTTSDPAITDHGDLSGLLDDDHTQYLNRSGIRPMTGQLDMGLNPIVNVTTVDGVDVSQFKTDTDAHIADTNNPHGTNIDNLPAFSLAQFNSKLQGGNVDFDSAARTPSPHATTHELGGSDEVVLQNLSSNGAGIGLVPATNGAGSFDLISLNAVDVIPTISIYNTGDGQQLIEGGAFGAINLNGINVQDTAYFSFSGTGSAVTILVAGQYNIDAYFGIEQFGGNNRSEAEFQVTRNGTRLPGMRGFAYSRQQNTGRNTPAAVQTFDLLAGDIIELQGRQTIGSGDLRPEFESCGMRIQLAEGIQGPQGEQGIPGTGSTILLNDDGVLSGAFTNINFIAATVTDQGGGQADVQFNPASTTFFFESFGGQTTFSDNNFRVALDLDQAVPNGTYEVQAYMETFSNNGGTEWTVLLRSNGATLGQQQVEPEDVDDQFQFNAFDIIDVTNGQANLEITIQRRAGTGQVTFRRPRILMKLLS